MALYWGLNNTQTLARQQENIEAFLREWGALARSRAWHRRLQRIKEARLREAVAPPKFKSWT